MAVVAIVNASGAAVIYEAGTLQITGLGKVTYEHIAALDQTSGLNWVNDDMRAWFYSEQIANNFSNPSTSTPSEISGFTDTEVREFISTLPSKYYQQQFMRIYESADSFQGDFNFSAFLLGALWALQKRLSGVFWISMGIVFLSSVVTDLLTHTTVDPYTGNATQVGPGGLIYVIAAICISVWLGLRGNWMVYNASIRGKPVFW